MCAGTLGRNEQTVRPGRRMPRVCASTLVHYEQPVRPGRRMRRVCANILVHYEHSNHHRTCPHDIGFSSIEIGICPYE